MNRLEDLRRRTARRTRLLRRRITGNGGAFVLMYHRIAEPPADPWGLCVSPARFAEQLAVLRRHANPMTLTALARARAGGALPRNAVSVTFDDGYVDNLRAAKPLLVAAGVPATVFLATRYAGRGRGFWWEEVQRLVLGPHALPTELALDGGPGAPPLRRTLSAEVRAARDPGADRGWRAFQTPPDARQALFLDLWSWCAALPDADARDRALRQLADAAGLPDAPGDARAMTAEEVRELVADGWVDVGAHTVSHPMLPTLSPQDQREEIAGSRRDVERLVGRPVTTFSYPHGRYDQRTRELVRETGFDVVCMSARDADEDRYDCAPVRGDLLHLPRLPMPDWDGAELLARLSVGFER